MFVSEEVSCVTTGRRLLFCLCAVLLPVWAATDLFSTLLLSWLLLTLLIESCIIPTNIDSRFATRFPHRWS